ncbi:hypothetical protein CPJ18_21825 [Agrobacterium rosae]|uniref:Uncharacterized protein n=1 Tax=Agrobacterium rosae TaxID=1972867 RepID=A0AAE5RUY4_9HYPH|nr:hypothetical protein DXM21_23190 [Agrobacterium rosae]KAA3513474.1 hypothetical protein DXM25_23385 [Agrobacterium rosae]MQB51030.1 hypothetical protein [Agrobacterium rosae]POO49379.1 hypothetical protein CPJ18_21825 [Agrobacterium rosae]
MFVQPGLISTGTMLPHQIALRIEAAEHEWKKKSACDKALQALVENKVVSEPVVSDARPRFMNSWWCQQMKRSFRRSCGVIRSEKLN